MKSVKVFFIILAIIFALAAALTGYLRAEKEASVYSGQYVNAQHIGQQQRELGMDRAIVVRYWPTFTLGLLAVISAGVAFTPQESKPKA
jgi:ABC-type dipeptide/oligopeptide/nickel transport system permease component